jgi:hypothetical protein
MPDDPTSEPEPQPYRACIVCGARVEDYQNDTCDTACKRAHGHGRTRGEQLRIEAETMAWPSDRPASHNQRNSEGRAFELRQD